MIKKFFEKLESKNFSKAEKKIAERIKKNLPEMAFLSGQEFAKECGVNSSTITRFAQKLGYTGYPQLKKELQKVYKKSFTPYEIFENFMNNKMDNSIINLTYEQDIKNINTAISHLNEENLNKIVRLIDRANRVFIAAIGASETLVDVFYYYFDALNKPYIALKGWGISKRILVENLNESDLVIGISFQRILKEVYEVLDFAKQKDVVTIAITDSELNSLATIADYSLIAPVVPLTFSLSITAPMVIINILLNSLAALNPEKSKKNLKKIQEGWNKLPIFNDY